MPKVAAVQMASGPNVNANLLEAERLLAMAAAHGAELAVLPENFAMMGMTEFDKVAIREVPGKGQLQEFLAQQALRHHIWLVGGTIPLVAEHDDKVRAACLLFSPDGRPVARYDKIHLFDVSLREGAEYYDESQTIEPGQQVVVAATPLGSIGLAVCYDLRFPEQFRAMLSQDVQIIVVPSAFTAITGRAHWESLLRARAIENLCFVIAAAQGGYHVNGRETHGDSMIIDPWGVILDRLPRGSGVVIADINIHDLHKIRQSFPALAHRRDL